MRILVNGACGRMGRALRAMIENGCQGASLAGMADAFGQEEGVLRQLSDFTGEADCIIDFSNHAATGDLTAFAAARKLPLVIATTGQTPEELALIEEAAKTIPVFLSGNMSLGIALLTQLSRMAARMFPDADIEIFLLVGRHENGKRTKAEIGIHSLRMGNTVGIHEVIVNTGTQIITLKHEAQDRSLFAEGALSAAAFLVQQAPGLYNMNHIVNQA